MKNTLLAILALSAAYLSPVLAAPKSEIESERALKKEVAALRAKLKEQEKRIRYQKGAITGVGGNAVRAPFGRFLLVKNGAQCLALRITEHVNFRVVDSSIIHTSKYEWFLQNDGSMDFSRPNVQKGSGEATEYKDETYAMVSIRAGSFPPLEWSSGDWIYFGFGGTPVGGHPPNSAEALREKNLRMASTEWIRLTDIKAGDKGLFWLSKEKE